MTEPAHLDHGAAAGPVGTPDLLRTDRRLNPDRRPDLYEAVVLGRAGRTREAIAVLRRTVAADPENLEAWARENC